MLLLDENPITCATDTPVSLYTPVLSALKTALEMVQNADTNMKYTNLAMPTKLEILFINDILYSKKNRDWLVSYYNTLAMNSAKLINVKYPPIECNYTPRMNVGEYFNKPLNLHSPLLDTLYWDLIVDHGSIYEGIDDLVELSRAMLIHMQPSSDEFPLGEPVWLTNIEYREFTAFDPIQKLHIKIARSDRGYRYFTSYISDNWKEVSNVPPEIDRIIDCILATKT